MESKKDKEKKIGLREKIREFVVYLFRRKPDLFFGFLRRVQPVFQSGKDGPVFVTLFADVREVLERPRVFRVMYEPMMTPSVGPYMLAHDDTVYNYRDKNIMTALLRREDLPEVRRLVGEFARECIREGLRPYESDLARSGGDGNSGDSGVSGESIGRENRLELVSSLTRRVPVLLTGAYFGFPGPDEASMLRWSRATQLDMFHNLEKDPEIHAANIQAGREMRAYLEGYLREKEESLRENPDQDDVLARLLQMKLPDSLGFDRDRILTNVMGLLVGGVETTSQAAVHILEQLFLRPEILARAKEAARAEDHELLFRISWEALRFNPINPVVFRRAAEDCVLAGGTARETKIKAGTVVLASGRSAMMDEREVVRPREFRIDRPLYHYVHTGYGMHTCLGKHVSEVQVPEIVRHVLLLENPRPIGPPDYADGPFPEAYEIAFERGDGAL